MSGPRRNTRQRAAILDALKTAREHPTADQLYTRLKADFPNLSLGTVYRNLNVLIDMGEVQKLEHGSGFDRFEATIEPHAHLICRECGNIEDYPLPSDTARETAVRRESGFRIEGVKTVYYGTCRICLSKQ